MVTAKPLSTRMEAPTSQAPRVQRGVPLRPGGNFASYMPQGGMFNGQFSGMGNMGSVPTDGSAVNGGNNGMGTMGLSQTRAMATLAKVMENSSSPLATLNSSDTQGGVSALQGHIVPLQGRNRLQRPYGLDGARMAVRVNSHKARSQEQSKIESFVRQNSPAKAFQASGANAANTTVGTNGLGNLAAHFESGKDGIAAIGYDRHGGTSYGKYQLSSRAGSMKNFMEFLETEDPDMAKRLETAGATNTGGRNGRMPDVWRQLAEESPERFEHLQDKFIKQSHFLPAVQAVAENTGLEFDSMPAALKEVLFSTAVQHGPSGAARIVSRAVSHVGQERLDPDKNTPEILKKSGEQLIRRIYALRSGQFGSSTASVQRSVKNRLNQEMGMAITMLKENNSVPMA